VQNKVLVVPLDSLSPEEDGSDYAQNGEVTLLGGQNGMTNGNCAHWIGLARAEELDLPVGCTVDSVSTRRDEPRVFIKCTGYTLAGRIYQYYLKSSTPHQNGYQNGYQNEYQNGYQNGSVPQSPSSLLDKPYGKLSIWRQSQVQNFDPDRWKVEQVWVPNPNDGVKIPMFIVRDKSLVKTGDSFCLLYGYGGFNISLKPGFSPNVASLLTHTGGLYCVANIRGGGEFGEKWHKAAVREKRPVAFADFEECGRYLIREGWTKKEKLVCQGGSNGGALIAAVMNRAGEEIFGAGIAQVG
jgi:prolyl oligopeptidase PreP (S9A serine peptidase family)